MAKRRPGRRLKPLNLAIRPRLEPRGGGCRNGVVYRASFLRNNDSRKVGDPIGFNAQRAMHIWDMKGRRRLAAFFAEPGRKRPGRCKALPRALRFGGGFARSRGRVS